MTARGKGIVGIAALKGPFFSLTSTTTPPPAVGHPAMAFAPKLSLVLAFPSIVSPSVCAICFFSFFCVLKIQAAAEDQVNYSGVSGAKKSVNIQTKLAMIVEQLWQHAHRSWNGS